MSELVQSDVAFIQAAKKQIASTMFGVEGIINALLLSLVARGHVLLEGNPGLGKTVLVKTLCHALELGDGAFKRIQFTPDLMPSDITGTQRPVDAKSFTLDFVEGPIFCDLLLADEINRATPKTQSAMLEAMAEFQVTVLGKQYRLSENIPHVRIAEPDGVASTPANDLEDVPTPFFVLATQNPVEQEGTYTLPEAQLDRFLLKVRMPFPARQILGKIIDQDLTALPGIERAKGTASEATNREQSIGRLYRLGRALRAATPSEPVRTHILNMVMASTGKFDEVAGLSSQSLSALKDFSRNRIAYPLGPRAATALSVAALGWAMLELEGSFEADALEANSKLGLASTVVPALRHRIKFRRDFSDEEDGHGHAALTEADQDDALVRTFAKLAAPEDDGYARDFGGALDGIAERLQL